MQPRIKYWLKVTFWLCFALLINWKCQSNWNDRPVACPYCGSDVPHVHPHSNPAQHSAPQIQYDGTDAISPQEHPNLYIPTSILYGYAMTRHANFHVLDEYSLTHVEHGVAWAGIFYLAMAICCRRTRRPRTIMYGGFIMGLVIETVWEVCENQPQHLQYYDFKGLQYCGDSRWNSTFDIISMAFGYLFVTDCVIPLVTKLWPKLRSKMASCFGRCCLVKSTKMWSWLVFRVFGLVQPWVIVVLLTSTINLLMEWYLFVHIRDGLWLSIVQYSWGIIGWPMPKSLDWIQEQRSSFVIKPGASCHHLRDMAKSV